jgi:hypothetical protein
MLPTFTLLQAVNLGAQFVLPCLSGLQHQFQR